MTPATIKAAGDDEMKRGEIPVGIGPTTPRRHITGAAALNIPQPGRNAGGDWHEHACWFAPEPETLKSTSLTDEKTYRPLLDKLGRRGLRDARPGLRDLGHPAGDNLEKIWAATHERAVIESAWELLDILRTTGSPMRQPPIDRWEMQRLIAYPDQWLKLHWWAWALRGSMTAGEQRLWDEWRREWRPWG